MVLKKSTLSPEQVKALDAERAKRDISFAAALLIREHEETVRAEMAAKAPERVKAVKAAARWSRIASNALPETKDLVIYRAVVSDKGERVKGYLGQSQYSDNQLEIERRLARELGCRPGAVPAEDLQVLAAQAGAASDIGRHYLLDIREAVNVPSPEVKAPKAPETITRELYEIWLRSDERKLHDLALRFRMAGNVVKA